MILMALKMEEGSNELARQYLKLEENGLSLRNSRKGPGPLAP
jgi:hypothetical protein